MCGWMRHTPWGRYPLTLLEAVCVIRFVTPSASRAHESEGRRHEKSMPPSSKIAEKSSVSA